MGKTEAGEGLQGTGQRQGEEVREEGDRERRESQSEMQEL